MAEKQEFRQAATYKITVKGEEITDLYPLLIEAKVELSRRVSAMCTLAFDTASQERRSGVFLSSASPVHEQNAVGMVSVAPSGDLRRKAGEVGSQAV